MHVMLMLCLPLTIMALMSLAERRWAASDAPSAVRANLAAFLLNVGVTALLLPLVSLSPLVSRVALVDLTVWPFALGLIAYTLLMDLGEYAFHRAQHRIPLLWKLHSLHHSDPNMNVTTTERHFWGDRLIKALTVWPACALILQPSPAIVASYWIISLYHIVIHSNVRLGFGRWSLLLNHPAYHRTHHSSDPRDFNINFAALFPVYDWLFGTYRRPEGYPATGLDRQPRGLIDLLVWPLRA